ncbi:MULTISPECIES: ATP synthase F1 subunit epsilon [unclassified Stenotrophomonas]|uniref:ATP synthase F1 subunit epsilon n=1 Tax=unclassified Stenotrophomonas TaxID=196198 RepID=UPI00249CDED2|nr:MULTISPECIES: ATP synthase F1 subunit epsilon [unclassified Stenotrophomonas]
MQSTPLPPQLGDAHAIDLQIISLMGELWSGEVREVSLPGSEGRFGVMARHAPLLSTLREGMVSVFPASSEPPLHVYVSGGYVEVQPGKVIVLADLALRGEDLDKARADAARQAASSPMAQDFTDDGYARLHAELMLQRLQNLRQLPPR